MKVKDLIRKLNKLKQDLPVVIKDDEIGYYNNINGICKDDDFGVIVLEQGNEFEENGE